jgi:hypothetical protein
MKSRLTYCQINDVIKEINKAVVGKYKIMHQPKASMNSVNRNLYQRFINEETKDTKGKIMAHVCVHANCFGGTKLILESSKSRKLILNQRQFSH